MTQDTLHLYKTPLFKYHTEQSPTVTICLTILHKRVIHWQMHSNQAAAINNGVSEEGNRSAGIAETDLQVYLFR